eukprot:jgi/Botrbrau1/3375/Bobra.0337s0016.1
MMADPGPPPNLCDIISAGDERTWSLADWNWDPENFVATKKSEGKEFCGQPVLEVEERRGHPPPNKPCTAANNCALNSIAGGLIGASVVSNTGSNARDGSFVTANPPWPIPTGRDGHAGGDMAEEKDTQDEVPSGAMVCQVEGCSQDLTNETAYHKRCRVCEKHAKVLEFTRNGRQQRFCQQCGRCHDLSKFEGNKRSCTAQLAKHNARRRRRQRTSEDSKPPDMQILDDVDPMACGSNLGLLSAFDSTRGGEQEGRIPPETGALESVANIPEVGFPAVSAPTPATASNDLEMVSELPDFTYATFMDLLMPATLDGNEMSLVSQPETRIPASGIPNASSPKSSPQQESSEDEAGDASASEAFGWKGGIGSSSAQPLCQVDDCRRNLLHLSLYHQRCRICELHIKVPFLMRRGKLQRFCQQCGPLPRAQEV